MDKKPKDNIPQVSASLDDLNFHLEQNLERTKRVLGRDVIRKIKIGLGLPERQSVKPETKTQLEYPPDCSVVTLNRRRFKFTGRQAKVIKFMLEERKKGNPFVSKDRILEHLYPGQNLKEPSLKDIFKKSPAWNTFIKPAKRPKGFYYLANPRPKKK